MNHGNKYIQATLSLVNDEVKKHKFRNLQQH